MPIDEQAQKIELIMRICDTATEIHQDTLRLAKILAEAQAPRYAASARPAPPEPRRAKMR